MTEDDKKALKGDTDGLMTYEYLANHIDSCYDDLDAIIDNMIAVDLSGQFLASAARYLHAIDPAKYADAINRLVSSTIDRDREHRYIGDLMTAIYGADFRDRAAELLPVDNNFRRIYKRLFPSNPI